MPVSISCFARADFVTLAMMILVNIAACGLRNVCMVGGFFDLSWLEIFLGAKHVGLYSDWHGIVTDRFL